MPCQRGHQRCLCHAARLESTTMILGRNGDDVRVPAEQGARADQGVLWELWVRCRYHEVLHRDARYVRLLLVV